MRSLAHPPQARAAGAVDLDGAESSTSTARCQGILSCYVVSRGLCFSSSPRGGDESALLTATQCAGDGVHAPQVIRRSSTSWFRVAGSCTDNRGVQIITTYKGPARVTGRGRSIEVTVHLGIECGDLVDMCVGERAWFGQVTGGIEDPAPLLGLPELRLELPQGRDAACVFLQDLRIVGLGRPPFDGSDGPDSGGIAA